MKRAEAQQEAAVVHFRRLRLSGRYMLPDRSEHECHTRVFASDRLELQASDAVAVGVFVIAYIDHVGRVEGVVEAPIRSGFRILIAATPAKRERMRRTVEWLCERQAESVDERRRHPRVDLEPPARVEIVFEGRRALVGVIDCSQGGVALQTALTLRVGDALTIDGIPSRIVRAMEGVLAARFDEVQPAVWGAQLQRAG